MKIDSKENLIRLVEEYRNLIFSICIKMTGDYFISEDITQETFIMAYKHYSEFDGNNEKSWICRIATNKCIDAMRSASQKMIPTAPEEIPDGTREDNDPMNLYIGSDVIDNVIRACNKLDSPYNDVAYLYFVKGLKAKEIAKQNGSNLKTVQTQIYRARDMLKKYIRKEDLLI